MRLNLNHLGTTLKALPGTCFSFVCERLKKGCQKTQAAAIGALAFLSSCFSRLCKPLKNWIFSKETLSSDTSEKIHEVASSVLAVPDISNTKPLSTVPFDVQGASDNLSSFPIMIETTREDGTQDALHLTYETAVLLLQQPKIRAVLFPNKVLFRNPSLKLPGLEMLQPSRRTPERKSIQIELKSEQFDILVKEAKEVKLQSAPAATDLDQSTSKKASADRALLQASDLSDPIKSYLAAEVSSLRCLFEHTESIYDFNGHEGLPKALAFEEEKKQLKIAENNYLAQEAITFSYLLQENALAYEFDGNEPYARYAIAQQPASAP